MSATESSATGLMPAEQISERVGELGRQLTADYQGRDLLVICVEAGLGFDAAMGKVYEKWDNELAIAFGRVLREIQLGKNRKDALKDMSDRLDVADVNSFTAAIIQAEQLGVSMAKILRVQADQMRIKRRQRALQVQAGQNLLRFCFKLVAAQFIETVVNVVMNLLWVQRFRGMIAIPGFDDPAQFGEFR